MGEDCLGYIQLENEHLKKVILALFYLSIIRFPLKDLFLMPMTSHEMGMNSD